MPDPPTLLAGLTEIANRASALAIAWHVVFAALGVGLLLGLRPSHRALAVGLSALLASVAGCAVYFGNPFNALVLGASALALLAARMPPERATLASGWARWLGALLLALGLWYPHFLRGSALAYVYAAPLGTVPCPTLSAAIGIALLYDAKSSRTFCRLLASVGVVYGLFGALRLGVLIDLVLLTGALGLLAHTWPARRAHSSAARPARA